MKNHTPSVAITPRDTRSMQAHLGEICNKKYDVLSIDEEVELATRSRNGDVAARNSLVEHNMRLAITIAKSYQNQGVDLEDLVVAAEMGLIAAAEQFDPTVGVKFISYACHHIRREITCTLTAEARTIRLPQNVVTRMRQLKRAIMRFQIEHDTIPTDDDLAEQLDLTPEEVHSLRYSMPGSVSIDTPLSDESDGTIGSMLASDTAPTDDGLEQESVRQEVSALLDSLSDRDATILRRSFGIGEREQSIDQIAEDIGLSRERVRQIREAAIRRVRFLHRDKFLNE